MTSVPMNPLKSARTTHLANLAYSAIGASPAVGINRYPGAHFARPAKSRARPPSP